MPEVRKSYSLNPYQYCFFNKLFQSSKIHHINILFESHNDKILRSSDFEILTYIFRRTALSEENLKILSYLRNHSGQRYVKSSKLNLLRLVFVYLCNRSNKNCQLQGCGFSIIKFEQFCLENF